MTESVLASLDAPSNEADSGQSEPTPSADAGGARGATPAAANAGGNAEVHTPAPGAAGGDQHRDPNNAEGKLVPLAALHESREKIRNLTSQIEELKKQPQLSEEDRELLKDLKAQRTAAQKPKPPEFIEDPKGYIDAKEQEVRDALKELRESETKRAESEKQQQQFQSLISTIATHEQAFVSSNPDYNDALAHVRTVRTQQLKMMFPDATDQQIQQQIGREEIGGAQQILARGGNPAEFAYNYAKTLGYAKKVAAPANGGMAAAAAAPEPEAKPDKDAVRSLGGGGGAQQDDAPADPMPEFTMALKERFKPRRK